MRKTNLQVGKRVKHNAAASNKALSKRALEYVKMLPELRENLFEKYKKQGLPRVRIEEIIEQELSTIKKRMLGR